jgi:hypothetical protein
VAATAPAVDDRREEARMDRTQRSDAADVLAGIGRHWGWVLVFWLVVFGIMEIVLAFRLRSLGHAAARIAPSHLSAADGAIKISST